MLDWYLALFVYSTYPHTHKGNRTMKKKGKKYIEIDTTLTETDIKISLLELKQKVGAPQLLLSNRAWRKR